MQRDADAAVVSVFARAPASVDLPAIDRAYHHRIASPWALEPATRARRHCRHLGRAPAERCAARSVAIPLNYALLAGLPEHREAARAMLAWA